MWKSFQNNLEEMLFSFRCWRSFIWETAKIVLFHFILFHFYYFHFLLMPRLFSITADYKLNRFPHMFSAGEYYNSDRFCECAIFSAIRNTSTFRTYQAVQLPLMLTDPQKSRNFTLSLNISFILFTSYPFLQTPTNSWGVGEGFPCNLCSHKSSRAILVLFSLNSCNNGNQF